MRGHRDAKPSIGRAVLRGDGEGEEEGATRRAVRGWRWGDKRESFSCAVLESVILSTGCFFSFKPVWHVIAASSPRGLCLHEVLRARGVTWGCAG